MPIIAVAQPLKDKLGDEAVQGLIDLLNQALAEQQNGTLKFVEENAAAIGTDIIVPESFNFNHTISDAIRNDPTAAANVAIIGGHIYGGGIGSYPLAESKGKEVWMTEHLDADTTWTDVFARGKEIKYNDFCIGITVLPFPVDSLNGRSEK